jgi:hypothetical protein
VGIRIIMLLDFRTGGCLLDFAILWFVDLRFVLNRNGVISADMAGFI